MFTSMFILQNRYKYMQSLILYHRDFIYKDSKIYTLICLFIPYPISDCSIFSIIFNIIYLNKSTILNEN